MNPALSRNELMIILLETMAGTGEPMGTRRARIALAEHGVTTSESSTSRLLRELDENGWTVPHGAKGRGLTDVGRRYLDSVLAGRQASELHRDAVNVEHVQDLLDLLQARAAVESAAAANAALRASAEDLADLDRIVQRHTDLVDRGENSSFLGLSFHRRIAALSQNKMLRAMTDLVLSPRLDHVEAVLDLALGDQRHESLAPTQHRTVLDALHRRDSAAAEAAMHEHLTGMIHEVTEFLQGFNEPVFERLLQWVAQQPGLGAAAP